MVVFKCCALHAKVCFGCQVQLACVGLMLRHHSGWVDGRDRFGESDSSGKEEGRGGSHLMALSKLNLGHHPCLRHAQLLLWLLSSFVR